MKPPRPCRFVCLADRKRLWRPTSRSVWHARPECFRGCRFRMPSAPEIARLSAYSNCCRAWKSEFIFALPLRQLSHLCE